MRWVRSAIVLIAVVVVVLVVRVVVVVVVPLVVPLVVAPVAPAAPIVRGALLVLTWTEEVVFIACGAGLVFGLLCSGLACLAVGIVIGIGALLVLTLGGRARSGAARVVAGPPTALVLVPAVPAGTSGRASVWEKG